MVAHSTETLQRRLACLKLAVASTTETPLPATVDIDDQDVLCWQGDAERPEHWDGYVVEYPTAAWHEFGLAAATGKKGPWTFINLTESSKRLQRKGLQLIPLPGKLRSTMQDKLGIIIPERLLQPMDAKALATYLKDNSHVKTLKDSASLLMKEGRLPWVGSRVTNAAMLEAVAKELVSQYVLEEKL